MNTVLIHYGEIALKGNNRSSFEKKLEESIRLSLGAKVKREQGRIVAKTDEDEKKIGEALSRIFGIEWFTVCSESEASIESMKKAALEEIGTFSGTFKVECSRSEKSFPLTSMQVNEQVGEEIVKKRGLKVALKAPEKTVFLEINGGKTRIFSEKSRGPGGLPIGSSGRVVCLLSGGIDSPVAAWMMMKRGCKVDFLHFHAMRENAEVKGSKLEDITKELRKYSPFSKLYVVPYYPFEPLSINDRYDLVIFRRFMMRVAGKLALQKRHGAIITGESLSQVASQTLENMACINQASSLPVLRPLVGMDKEEIISLAKRIGTYEHSIRSYKDCCSLIARHPATKASLEKVKVIEESLDIARAEEECLKLAERIDL